MQAFNIIETRKIDRKLMIEEYYAFCILCVGWTKITK